MKRLILLLTLISAPLWALEPSEMLPDSALETRSRALDHALRCVVCQSESVASSNADWAKEARRTIRELVSQGASDRDVMDFFVDRYGEFVLMAPRASGSTWVLWASGPVMLLLAGGLGLLYLRNRAGAQAPQEITLTEEETTRLREIMKE